MSIPLWLKPNPWLLLYSLPPLLVFWAIINFGVDTIYGDELLYLPRLIKLADNTFAWSDIFSLHYDHRPAIPFLITAASVFTVGWHAPFKFFFALLFALVSAYLLHKLLCHTHPHLPRPTHQLFTLLALTFTTSLLQFDIWFQGMFLSLPLLMLCYLGALWILTVKKASWPALISATLLCLAATLTLHQGILTFFALLPLLFANPTISHRYHKVAYLAVVGLLVTTLYHQNYIDIRSGGQLSYGLNHPVDFVQFITTFWGSILAPLSPTPAANIGVILLLTAIALSARLLSKPQQRLSALPWLSLICFVFLLSFATALGRSYFGPGYALRPRYLAMSAFGLIAIIPLLITFFQVRQLRSQLVHVFMVILICSQLALGLFFLPNWRQKSQSLQAGRHCLLAYHDYRPTCLGNLSDGAITSQQLATYAQELHHRGLLSALVR